MFYILVDEKHLITEGTLNENKFEDLEQDARTLTEDIYKQMNITNFEASKGDIENYLSKKKGYKKNQYKYDDKTIKIVVDNWGMELKEWEYQL